MRFLNIPHNHVPLSLMIPSSLGSGFLGIRAFVGSSTAMFAASESPSVSGTIATEAMAATILHGVGASDSTVILPPLDQQERESLVPSHKRLRSALGLLPAFMLNSIPREKRPRPKIVGHRGALYDHLENTRPAFLRCVELGCDGIELDVFLTKDCNLVVFHGSGSDATPGSLLHHCLPTGTANKGSIIDMTYDEICQLKFNPTCDEFPCPKMEIQTAQVPLLSEVLSDVKGTGLQVKIELKGPTGAVVPHVLELVESMNMVDQCCYSSFHHDWLRQLREMRPDPKQYPTGALFEVGEGALPKNYLELARDCGATEIHIPYSLCSVDVVQEIHQNGFGSMVWFRGPVGMAEDMRDKYWDVGNEDEACYQVLMDTGVQQLCLNRPNIAMEMVNRYTALLQEEQGQVDQQLERMLPLIVA